MFNQTRNNAYMHSRNLQLHMKLTNTTQNCDMKLLYIGSYDWHLISYLSSLKKNSRSSFYPLLYNVNKKNYTLYKQPQANFLQFNASKERIVFVAVTVEAVSRIPVSRKCEKGAKERRSNFFKEKLREPRYCDVLRNLLVLKLVTGRNKILLRF